MLRVHALVIDVWLPSRWSSASAAAVRLPMPTRCATAMIKAPSAALVGEIAAFIYRCPNTGLPIQALSAAEGIAEGEKTYEPVTCIMCRQVHLVNAFTGKVLGDDNE